MDRAEPRGEITVATHREPRARRVIDAAIGRGQRREHRSDEEQNHQRHRVGQPSGVEQRRHGLTEIFPRHQPRTEVPGHRRCNEQSDDASHCAQR